MPALKDNFVLVGAPNRDAFVEGEFEVGVAGLAGPIRTQSGTTAGLGLSAPRERFADEDFRREAVECLRECAGAVAGLL